MGDFNPRFREGSDVVCKYLMNMKESDFNPRFREGSDCVNRLAEYEDLEISIHASAREATRCTSCKRQHNIYFNPRFREGSDGA